MIIDIHGHVGPPEDLNPYPMPPSLRDVDGMIEQKEQVGISLTIVGSPVGLATMMPVPGLDPYAQPPERLKALHDWLAETVAAHPGRLKAYAYTNPFGDDWMLRDTAQMVKDGGFVGLIINTSVRGEYLDSERADAFFAMAAELDVPILLHPPAEPVGRQALRDFRLVETVGRFCDVTVSLATLVFGGRLEQYPNLKIIGATAGGAIALLPERLDLAYLPRHWAARAGAGAGHAAVGPGGAPSNASPGGSPPIGPPGPPPVIMQYQNRITRSPSTYLKDLYVDTANLNTPNLLANLQLMGADHVLFATDSPPLVTPLQASTDLVNDLPIADEDKQKIFSGNAMRLFKLGDR